MTTFHRPTANYLFIYQAIWRYFATTAIHRTKGHHPYHWRACTRPRPTVFIRQWSVCLLILALGKWCRRSNESDTLLWGEFINKVDSILYSDTIESEVYVPTGANQFRCMKIEKPKEKSNAFWFYSTSTPFSPTAYYVHTSVMALVIDAFAKYRISSICVYFIFLISLFEMCVHQTANQCLQCICQLVIKIESTSMHEKATPFHAVYFDKSFFTFP